MYTDRGHLARHIEIGSNEEILYQSETIPSQVTSEQKASRQLKEAADVIAESPIALQLRYLQTLTQISAEKNSTIVFPIPVELLSLVKR
ncbi:unnamed protein product [Rotaria sp. Silwood1]|nr:unnamed protein product [Rotaria sp. Silwood1]